MNLLLNSALLTNLLFSEKLTLTLITILAPCRCHQARPVSAVCVSRRAWPGYSWAALPPQSPHKAQTSTLSITGKETRTVGAPPQEPWAAVVQVEVQNQSPGTFLKAFAIHCVPKRRRLKRHRIVVYRLLYLTLMAVYRVTWEQC